MEERFLTLMRHGKAARLEDVEDFQRPLTERGITDSALMAAAVGERTAAVGERTAAVGERTAPVDLLLMSAARRARLTGEIVGSVLNLPPGQLFTEDRFYMAEPEQLSYRVREIPSEIRHLLLVGHNPAMEELAAELAGRSIDHLPTAGVVLFRIRADRWEDLHRDRAVLQEILTPKLLKRR